MIDSQATTGDRSELTGIIHQIRKRWRLKLALRGAAFVLAGGVLVLLASAYGLERLKFSPGSIIAFLKPASRPALVQSGHPHARF